MNVWLVTDRKPGHVAQLAGLAAALADRTYLCERWIDAPWQPSPETLGGSPPDLIVCCGRATQKPALALQAAHGGMSVVLMRPAWPWLRFDVAVVPEHDRPRSRPSVIATQGALNAVRRSEGDTGRGLILLGGPSRHVAWNDRHVLAEVDALVASSPGIRWRLTTSRRTPGSMLCPLIERQGERLRVIPCEQTPPGWVADQLAAAGHAVVTEDSVSMISEAATSGCVTSVIGLPPLRRRSRVLEGVQRLIDAGLICRVDDRAGFRPAAPLAEADRVAGLLLRRLPQSVSLPRAA